MKTLIAFIIAAPLLRVALAQQTSQPPKPSPEHQKLALWFGERSSGTLKATQVKAAPKEARRFSLDHLNRLVRLSDPQIAPDGKCIALAVARANLESNRWENELVLVDTATGTHRPLTRNRREVRHPRWSPTGDRLAFLAPDGTGKEETAQVFVLPMNGGEAQRITKSPTAVQHFSWRPDGREIAFAAADEAPNKKAMEKGDDAFEVGNDDLFTTAAPMPVHIWLVPAEGGDARVPPTQSYKLYHALKDAGVPVSFIAYPVSGHFPADPVRARDVYRRWADWLDKHLGATASAGGGDDVPSTALEQVIGR
jgi:dipeptidyl aminopeptidase/acylaminoacyl peptidase